MTPTKALHPCAQPRCPHLTAKARCQQHDAKRAYYTKHPRGSSTTQGYGVAWQRIRRQVLREEPVCRICRAAQSTVVDHIIPRKRGGTDERGNLQGLDAVCHNRKTAREDGRWTKRQ